MDAKPNPVDAGDIVRNLWIDWAARDKTALLSRMADNAILAIYIPEDVLPFGGETVGKASISDRTQTILDQFHTVHYSGEIVKIEGDVVVGRVEYQFRHKITGEEIDGVMRHVIEVRDGLIVHLKEYHDIERIRAFMRLVAYAAAD